MAFKESIRHILMSKAVATAYLKGKTTPSSTLTVYATSQEVLSSFEQRVSSRYGDAVGVHSGFDRVTFLISDRDIADAVVEDALALGLDITGF